MDGWIKLYRKIIEHPFYHEKRVFSRHEAWEFILLNANHSDKKIMISGQMVEIQRGSFITSEGKLMDRFQWGKEKLRKFLKLLESERMICRSAKKLYTEIYVNNYEKYQSKSDHESDQIESSTDAGSIDSSDHISDRKQTTDRPHADYRPATTKNEKNLKNEKKDISDLSSPPAGKIQFAEMVFLKQEEADKLITDFGKSEFDYWVAQLSDYHVENMTRPSKIKSDHNRTIRNWIRTDRRRKEANGMKGRTKSGSGGQSIREMAEQLKREKGEA